MEETVKELYKILQGLYNTRLTPLIYKQVGEKLKEIYDEYHNEDIKNCWKCFKSNSERWFNNVYNNDDYYIIKSIVQTIRDITGIRCYIDDTIDFINMCEHYRKLKYNTEANSELADLLINKK